MADIPTKDGKIACVSVTRPETHGSGYKCISRLGSFDLGCEFDGAEEGESITITLKFLTEEEIRALPDFDGW